MKQNLLTHILRLTILFLLFLGWGTGSAVAGTGLECRGTTPTKPTALASDLADPAVGPALLDFLSGNTAGITAAARVNRLKAWEVVSSDPNFSNVVANLEKIDGHLAKNIHTAEELETAFIAAANKVKWIDDIGYNVLRKADRNAEYVNPNNKLLKWSEEANVNSKIDDWLQNTSGNKQLEAQVADVIRGQKPVEGLGIQVKRANNTAAGDLDVYTANELIEVKAGSGSINYNQLNKYVDSTVDDFINPYDKKVILYIDQPMSSSVRQTVEGNLPSEVFLANSHSELLGLLD